MSYFDPHDKEEQKALLGVMLMLALFVLWLSRHLLGR